MSWTDDIRCLHCDGKLPLYRKITHGQFCCSAHRKAYWLEQERLGVERLEQTHNALHAYRPPGAVAAILGHAEPQHEALPPDPAGLVREVLPNKLGEYSEIVAADPIPYEMGPRPYVLFELQVEGLPAPAPAEFLPVFCAAGPAMIASTAPTEGFEDWGVMRPYLPDFKLAPARMEELPETVDTQIPVLESQLPLSRPQALENFVEAIQAAPISVAPLTRLPQDAAFWKAALSAAPLLRLATGGVALVQGTRIDSAVPIGLNCEPVASPFMPPSRLTLQARIPTLPVGVGRLYSIAAREPAAVSAKPEQVAFSSAPRVSLPQPPATPARTEMRITAPGACGLVRMSLAVSNAILAAQSNPSPQPPLLIPQPPRTQPAVPASKLEPLNPKPIDATPLAEMPAATPVEAGPVEAKPKVETPLLTLPAERTARPPVRKAHPWMPAVEFLRNAPRDLKMLVFAIPVLLGLALHPSLPKVSVSAPASTSGIERNVESAMNSQLVTFRQSMLDRAAVALDEDFRSGLDDWVSRDDATADWSFDATGFVQPGPLALYRPSLGLTDYQLQFLGMIDKKALSWVVRAADFKNYYVVKLVVLKPGPLPTIGVTRYAVLNGKPEARADAIAPVDARTDMLYRVRLDVHGDMFVLVVQGQVIDSWSEPRLQHGGVGFFSARGESSRLRWVQVTHQYDMLGRLCAYLAPYNNPTSNGSFQP